MPVIAAIDPGSRESGWVLMDDGAVLDSGVSKNKDLVFRCNGSNALAIEMIQSYGNVVGRDVFMTCVWIGQFLERWQMISNRFLLHRSLVKWHLCQSARARDSNVRAALIERYGPTKQQAIGLKKSPGPLYGVKSHAWAALGVAVTFNDIVKGGMQHDTGPVGEIVRRHLSTPETYLSPARK